MDQNRSVRPVGPAPGERAPEVRNRSVCPAPRPGGRGPAAGPAAGSPGAPGRQLQLDLGPQDQDHRTTGPQDQDHNIQTGRLVIRDENPENNYVDLVLYPDQEREPLGTIRVKRDMLFLYASWFMQAALTR